MKMKKLLILLTSSVMVFSYLIPNLFQKGVDVGEDNAIYDDQVTVSYDNPEEVEYDTVRRATEPLNGFILHYHNDDGKCLPGQPDSSNVGREFWVWSPSNDGAAFQPESAGASTTDITLKLDFNGAHSQFAHQTSVSFIVKFKGKDNWDGKSQNTLITFDEYEPNADGYVELWALPGEASYLEIYKTEAETHMDRIVAATFASDWKTIHIYSTAAPTTVKLYALTGSYLKLNAYMQQQNLPNYLIASATNPQWDYADLDGTILVHYTIKLNYLAKVNVQYFLNAVFPDWSDFTKTKYVSSYNLYETPRFTTYYNYDGNDLGATYNDANSTTFKVWAPTAGRVRLKLFTSGTSTNYDDIEPGVKGKDTAGYYNMSFRPGGIWEVTLTGQDLKNSYYNYVVYNSFGTSTVADPYAKGCGINGERSMVVNWADTNPTNWDSVPTRWDNRTGYDIQSPNELSIYETHIRDLTMDSSWISNNGTEPGTFPAFVESGTRVAGTSVTSGFDHLKELGVKAIQLQPVFDHDNAEQRPTRHYNWGYNPLNYNCVEGSYSTDPYDGYTRIREFKQLVKAFADSEAHTRVIMDVVYNHVSSASDSCFNKLMPRYYFRCTESGDFYNGSGCGNECKSEAPMMRKYIVDSLVFWATEYKIKGFRFDLMALIDLGTIDAARHALYEVDPDIYLYGEGWTGDSSGYNYEHQWTYVVHGHGGYHDNDPLEPIPADQMEFLGCTRSTVYRYLYKGYNNDQNVCWVGAFNDTGREAMKGNNDCGSYGFINKGIEAEKVANMLVGYHKGYGENPYQCVNYVSCHDDFALYDQVRAVDTTSTVGAACAATVAAECAVLFSNGVAFIYGGEEVFRSKVIEPGSDDDELCIPSKKATINGEIIAKDAYNLSDAVNAIEWGRKINIGDVDTRGYVKGIVDAVHARNNLAKYNTDQLHSQNPFHEGDNPNYNVWTGAGRDVDGWDNWDTQLIAVHNQGYFLFLCGVGSNEISFDAYHTGAVSQIVFTSNRVESEGYYGIKKKTAPNVEIGWFTAVCLHA